MLQLDCLLIVALTAYIAHTVTAKAGVVQWQNGSFPSCIRGFDSLHPLHSFPRVYPEAV
jgi:hypothetical protein